MTAATDAATLVAAMTARLAAVSNVPRREAQWLLESVPATATDHAGEIETRLQRRLTGEPLAYVLGEWEFWSLPLVVTPDVLVPRPETELLVERALLALKGRPAPRVLDLGTGSGAVALAVATERRDARVTATDASAAALAVARGNAERLGVDNVCFANGDWYAAVADTRFDVIISNPPYVAVGDPALAADVAAHEPALALLAGNEGLDALRVIVDGAAAHLQGNGALLLEHGYRQGDAVRALLRNAGFAGVETWPDLSGQPRVSAGVRP